MYVILSSLFSVGRREPIEEFSSQICILQTLAVRKGARFKGCLTRSREIRFWFVKIV